MMQKARMPERGHRLVHDAVSVGVDLDAIIVRASAKDRHMVESLRTQKAHNVFSKRGLNFQHQPQLLSEQCAHNSHHWVCITWHKSGGEATAAEERKKERACAFMCLHVQHNIEAAVASEGHFCGWQRNESSGHEWRHRTAEERTEQGSDKPTIAAVMASQYLLLVKQLLYRGEGFLKLVRIIHIGGLPAQLVEHMS